MRIVMLHYLCYFQIATAAKETRSYFHFFGTLFRIGGDPTTSHVFAVEPSFQFADLIAIDANCGQWESNCSRYCEDGTFLDIYCSYKCRKLSPQSHGFICNENRSRTRFNGSLSRTAKPLGIDWKWESAELRKMYGRIWSESIELSAFPIIQSIQSQMRIVSADSFDTRVLRFIAGVLGLAPGPDNPFAQMVKVHNLGYPIVSMAMNYWPVRGKLRKYRTRFTTTVGYLDMGRCADWKFVDSISADRWAFQIDEIDFMGSKVGKTMGAFSFKLERFALISAATAQKLLADGIMRYYSALEYGRMDAYTSRVRCDAKNGILPPTRIRAGDVELVFDETATFRSPIINRDWTVTCLLNINMDRRNPHHLSNVWIFGKALYREYCLAFDYANLRIGFAKLRKSPFPYLQKESVKFFA